MDKKVKIIANYLPQFHQIPENDKWWGKGFTDWISVKGAEPVYEGHRQPRIPLNYNYYDLSEVENIRWQAKLAREHGIYAFGIYHYWFSSEMQLLQKPAELILQHKDIDINFMFIWDNFTWTRTWSKLANGNSWAPEFDTQEQEQSLEDSGILAELKYGREKECKDHFDYLLQFFKDDRYIKIEGKPVFTFYQSRNNFKIIKKWLHIGISWRSKMDSRVSFA